MDDERLASRRALRWPLAIAGALLLATAAFAAGRATTPERDAHCDEARDVYTGSVDYVNSQTEPSAEVLHHGLMLANVVEQNPDCFNAQERAFAGTTRDIASP